MRPGKGQCAGPGQPSDNCLKDAICALEGEQETIRINRLLGIKVHLREQPLSNMESVGSSLTSLSSENYANAVVSAGLPPCLSPFNKGDSGRQLEE